LMIGFYIWSPYFRLGPFRSLTPLMDLLIFLGRLFVVPIFPPPLVPRLCTPVLVPIAGSPNPDARTPYRIVRSLEVPLFVPPFLPTCFRLIGVAFSILFCTPMFLRRLEAPDRAPQINLPPSFVPGYPVGGQFLSLPFSSPSSMLLQ